MQAYMHRHADPFCRLLPITAVISATDVALTAATQRPQQLPIVLQRGVHCSKLINATCGKLHALALCRCTPLICVYIHPVSILVHSLLAYNTMLLRLKHTIKLAFCDFVFEPREAQYRLCLLYTSPSPRDRQKSRMPSSA